MEFSWWTFGLQTINFIVLVWLLKVLLYGPVKAAIARRQTENLAAMEKTKEVEKLAQEEIAKFAAKSEEIEDARKEILAEARIVEARAYDKLIQEGRDEVSTMRGQAQKEIEKQKHQAQIEMRQGAADLAVILARHIIEQSRSADLNELFLNKIVAYLKSMEAAEFDQIKERIEDKVICVITAEELDTQTQKHWSEVIGHVFGQDLNFTYSCDPSLIAGAVVQLSDGAISFNWRDSLDQAKEALYQRTDKQ